VVLLAEGLSNRSIARRLGVTEHTAKFHVNAILGKLRARSRADAVARALRLGLVPL
jgi:DNA-binding NarL/FixJ family response regulator